MQHDTRSIDELIAAQKPGFALEQRFYTDPEIYSLEIERIFMREWILAGHQSELPAPGDFKVFRLAAESAIIVRGKQGDIRAFANVCRHRGSRVCLEASGTVRKFVCPYHGWTYDIEGNLIAARNMPDDFDKTGYGLKPVAVDTVHGMIMICFGDNPPSLENARRDLARPFAAFDFENLKVAAYQEYDIPANWKLSIENYQECYHCATAHPDYAKMHTLMLAADKRERLQVAMRERTQSCGLVDAEVDHWVDKVEPGETSYGYWRTALFDGYKTGSKGGEPVAPLLGTITDYDGGASDIEIGPLSFLLAYSDHIVGYIFTPVDLEHSRCDVYWFVRGDAEEGRDYNVAALTWLWDTTTKADKEIIVNNWNGVRSRHYEPGPLSRMEDTERCYIEWILRMLQRD